MQEQRSTNPIGQLRRDLHARFLGVAGGGRLAAGAPSGLVAGPGAAGVAKACLGTEVGVAAGAAPPCRAPHRLASASPRRRRWPGP